MCDNPPNIDFYQRIFTCILLNTKFDIFISDKFYIHKLVSLYHHHKFGFWNLVPHLFPLYTSRFSILLMISSISPSQLELLRVGLVWAVLT